MAGKHFTEPCSSGEKKALWVGASWPADLSQEARRGSPRPNGFLVRIGNKKFSHGKGRVGWGEQSRTWATASSGLAGSFRESSSAATAQWSGLGSRADPPSAGGPGGGRSGGGGGWRTRSRSRWGSSGKSSRLKRFRFCGMCRQGPSPPLRVGVLDLGHFDLQWGGGWSVMESQKARCQTIFEKRQII